MKRFRNRIFIQILIPILLVYTLVIGFSLRWVGASFRRDALAGKRAAMENITRGLDDWLLSRVSEVLQLSRVPLFRHGSEAEILALMTSWHANLSFLYENLYLVEPTGEWRSAGGASGILHDSAYIERFFDSGSLFTYAGPHRYRGNILRDCFVIGAPVYSAEGEMNRILTATISRPTLNRIFGLFSFEDFDSWMVVNAETTIILHEDDALSGRREEEVYGRVFLSDGSREGRESFVRIMRGGWKMVTFLRAESLMAPFRGAANLMVILAGVLILVMILIVAGLSAAVSRPVKRLTLGVHRMMHGDYSRRIESDTGDELAELADAFNRLSERMAALRTEDRFRFLGHVAARMAHELRKPLHVIQLAGEALEREVKTAGKSTGKSEGNDTKSGHAGRRAESPAGGASRIIRNIGIINEEIESAERFVSEILSFSQNEALDKQLYSPALLLSRTVEKYRLLGAEHGIALTLENLTPVPDIFIDVLRIEEVFSNILRNAVNAMLEMEPPADPAHIHITLELEAGSEIVIRVYDRGPGFDESVIDRLFDPYFTTREQGCGLGLSICYRILSAHGAAITLENTPGGRGLVTMRFPI